MRKTLKIFAFLVSAIILAGGIFTSCKQAGSAPANVIYNDYRDIPGVNQWDIDAVEKIKENHSSFSYAINYSTEAFYSYDGSVEGYSEEFCAWLSELFGIEFIPEVREWGDLIQGMENGEVDFTGELTPTPARKEKYFMTTAIAERSIKYFRIEGSEKLAAIQLERPLRYGFLDGSTTYDDVKDLVEYEFTTTLIDDYDEAVSLLEKGEIDAFFEEGTAEAALDEYGMIVAKDFLPLVYSTVSMSTQNPELEPVINIVQKYLDNGMIYHLTDMYNSGQEHYLSHKLEVKLSDAEREYLARRIENGRLIKLAAEKNNYPSSFYNRQENEWQGITFDVLKEIEKITGLGFEVVNGIDDEWETIIEMVEKGEADMVTELLMLPERQSRFLWAQAPYSTDNYALISKMEHEDIKINQVLYSKVGLPENTDYEKVFLEWFPAHQGIVYYDSTEAAFEGLENDEVDFVMSSGNLLLSLTNYSEKAGFKANIVFDRTYESCFGFNKDEELLVSIIDKAQRLVDYEGIAGRWTRKVFDYRSKLAQSQRPYFIGLVSLLFLVLFLLLVLALRSKQSKERLELTVKQRTRELEIQTDAAKVASRAKGEFLARMSHEIRTPLNAVMGMSQIAREALPEYPQKAKESISQVLEASRHLLGILNDVLDMSKIESGKFNLMESAFSLPKMLEEVDIIIRQRCIENGIDYLSEINGRLPDKAIVGDKLRLKQVLINLLGNAVKFTPPRGKICLEVNFIGEDEKYARLEFRVSDTGIGMSPEQMEDLFLPFEQAGDFVAASYGGTGLGLSISQNLVEKMGSEIKVTSAPGMGSSFYFAISFEKSNEILLDLPQADIELSLEDKRMLLVEDIEINRLILIELLADTHISIDEAEDGAKALEMFSSSPAGYYDIIFMDVQMPVMGGYDATREIRKLNREDACKVPILAMTANAYKEDVDMALDSGMNGHLAKPVDMQAVRRALKIFIS